MVYHLCSGNEAISFLDKILCILSVGLGGVFCNKVAAETGRGKSICTPKEFFSLSYKIFPKFPQPRNLRGAVSPSL